MFKSLNSNNASTILKIQGAYGQNSNANIATIAFQNYDIDSKMVHTSAEIVLRDPFGDSNVNGAGMLVFRTADGSRLQDCMVVGANGNVGMGVARPVGKLHVNGDAIFDGNLTVRDVPVTTGREFFVASMKPSVSSSSVSTYTVYQTMKTFLEGGTYLFTCTYCANASPELLGTVLGTVPALNGRVSLSNTTSNVLVHERTSFAPTIGVSSVSDVMFLQLPSGSNNLSLEFAPASTGTVRMSDARLSLIRIR